MFKIGGDEIESVCQLNISWVNLDSIKLHYLYYVGIGLKVLLYIEIIFYWRTILRYRYFKDVLGY